MVMPMVDVWCVEVRVFDGFVCVGMTMDATGRNLGFSMVVCVVTILVLMTMVVLNNSMNVFMGMLFTQQ